MIQVSNDELSKIAQFVASCDDMINGKFILADVKITKVLNMIAGSDELYRYISECMVGFDFAKEYHRAEVKNSLNGGNFAAPTDPNKLVAFVFCLLVECDAKRLDFYNFINDNFGKEGKSEAYKVFASQLLLPFKEVVSSHFGMGGISSQTMEDLTQSYRKDLQEAPIFEAEDNKTYFDSSFDSNIQYNSQVENQNGQYDLQKANDYYNQNNDMSYMQNNSSQTSISQNTKRQETDIWKEICEIVENIESAVYAERHLKEYLRQELLYILKTIKYSTKYKDVKIISALVTAFDELSKKFRSIQFVFGELKNKLEKLYE